ncbi:tetratricopeptide repeat protein [Bowmanella dokdonensis]|uniref:Tetratricopeptide repeat protein n=1 Tax=Bowmanella dokdonensis TaxID=751969 RepID=A0A939ISZ7_9ALTE|nr:hypothetical protein [Bowmanella dokdonensis]MBN7827252.1 hypothetical protein [Bowmanella dokdonensis]
MTTYIPMGRIQSLFTLGLGILLIAAGGWSGSAIGHENHRHQDDKTSQHDPGTLSFVQLQEEVSRLPYLSATDAELDRLREVLEQANTSGEDESVKRLYLLARLQQHQHDFQAAQNSLTKALELAPHDASLLLLSASVANNLGEHEQALSACRQLIGQTGNSLIAACVTDTRMQMQPDNLPELYQSLLRTISLSPVADTGQQYWISQILAELALGLDKPDAAMSHLDESKLAGAPVSYVALWADVQFALKNHQQVLDRLTALTASKSPINDALLLRLAMAERFTQAGQQWLEAMQARISQRSAEHNYAHAAEMAKFYLYVDPDPQQAAYWARLNAEHAKSATDMALLNKAKLQVVP